MAEHAVAASLPTGKKRVMLSGDTMSIAMFEEKLLDQYVPDSAIGEVENWLLLHEAVTAEPTFRKDDRMAGLAGTDGFVRCVGDLIRQIKMGLVTDRELSSISRFAGGKELWIKKVFNRYERSLKKNGRLDFADRRILLIKKLSKTKSEPLAIARFSGIHLHDIYHFTPFRFELVRILGSWKNLVVRFPLPDDRRKVFGFVERDIQKFQSLEDEAGGVELEFDETSTRGDSPIEIFSSKIFDDDDREPYAGTLNGALEILKCSSRYREIEEVAERMLKLKGERSWSDFGIVFRSLQKYGAIVEDVFRRANIPVYLRRGLPVRENPYVRVLMSIFRAVETEFDRDEIVKIAASSYFSFLPPSIPPYSFEQMVIKAGVINGPIALWKKKLAPVSRQRGMAGVNKKLFRLLAAMEKLSRARRALDCLRALQAVIKLLKPREIVFRDAFSVRDSYCRAQFESVLFEIEQALSLHSLRSAQFDWRDLKRLLLNSLGNAHSPDWSDRDHVYALNLHDLAGRDFPYLFVCGLHDGEFPKAAEGGSVLSEAEKKEFNKIHADVVLAELPKRKRGRQVFTRIGESWDEESFLFYLAARSARQKLTLCYSTNELNGEELARSVFLDDIAAAFPDVKETSTEVVALEKDYSAQVDNAARESKLLRDLFQTPLMDAGGLRDLFHSLAARKGSGPSFLLSCERSREELDRAAFYTEFDPEKRARKAGRFSGKIDGKKIDSLAGYFDAVVRHSYSPTSLERYANCPFRYFMEKVLGCEPQKLPRADSERTLQGSVVHEIVESYYILLKSDPLSPRLPKFESALKLMRECEKKVFAQWEADNDVGDEHLWEMTKKQIAGVMSLFVRYEEESFLKEEFSTIATEFKFGDKKREVVVKFGGRSVSLKGEIDRVDYLPQKKLLRVIDYKHTANISKYSKLLKPETFCLESFQVPIYLFAALSLIGKKTSLPEPRGGYGAYYALKKEPKLSAKSKAASVFDDLEGNLGLTAISESEEFGGRIVALVGRMESGDFSVTPKDCIFCKFGPACRYREVRKVETYE